MRAMPMTHHHQRYIQTFDVVLRLVLTKVLRLRQSESLPSGSTSAEQMAVTLFCRIGEVLQIEWEQIILKESFKIAPSLFAKHFFSCPAGEVSPKSVAG
jgi:hypothetical protein